MQAHSANYLFLFFIHCTDLSGAGEITVDYMRRFLICDNNWNIEMGMILPSISTHLLSVVESNTGENVHNAAAAAATITHSEPVGLIHLIELFTDTLLRIAYTNYKATSHLDSGWERNLRSFPTVDVVFQFLLHFGIESVCSDEAVQLILWCYSTTSAVTGRRSPVMGEGEDMDLISQKLVNWFDMLTWMLRPTCTSLTSLNGAEASHLLDQDERIYPLLCHRLLARAVKLLQEDQNCKLIEPLLIIWSDPKPIQYGEPLTSDQLNAKLSYTIIPGTDEEMRGEFRYSPHNGEILDAGTHSLRVCYIPIDSTRFPLIEQTVSLTVTKLKPEVRWIDDLGEIEIGEELGASQLCAECFNPLDLRTPLMGSFFYSRSAGYVFSKVGKFEITASFFPESWNFTQASLTRYIKVTPRKSTEPTPKIEPTIEWDSREHPPLKVGEELSDLHLHATILEEGILGNFFYSKPYGYVFSKPGDYDIVATFVPQEPFDWRYKQVSKTIRIKVIHKDPLRTTIIWENPEPITYGTPLSETQLCAMCVDLNNPEEVTGSYKYSHQLGSILEPGEHMVEVSFTPADVTAYKGAYAFVNLFVLRIVPVVDWPPIEHPIHVHDGLPAELFNAVCTNNVEGSVRYSRPAGHVYSRPGRYELTVDFMPQDPIYYAPVTCTNHVNVIKPVTYGKVMWDVPEEIEFGTPLSELQLNAHFELEGTINSHGIDGKGCMVVPGQYFYNPGLSTVLDAGIQVLNVHFAAFEDIDLDLRYEPKHSVSISVAKIKPIIQWAADLGQIEVGEELTAKQLCAACFNPLSPNESVDGTYFYSRSAGFSFHRPGVYEIEVTFLPAEYYGRNFRQTTATATVEVLPALSDLEVVWPFPASIDYTTPLSEVQLAAYAVDRSTGDKVKGEFEYEPVAGTILEAGRHTLKVSFQPDSRPGHVLTKTVEMSVNKCMPTIVWPDEIPNTIFVGEELTQIQLNAATEPENAEGSFSYSVPIGFTFGTPGSYDLVATFKPSTSNYYQAVKMSRIRVIPKINEVHSFLKIHQPPDIDYGTPLSEEMLQANCIDSKTSVPVPGVYRYSPLMGSILDAGEHTITVSFAPNDASIYSVLEKSRTITVRKLVPKINWDIPEDTVFVGVELTDDVLDACLEDQSIDGTFFYSRTVGFAYSKPGMYELSVTFVPSDEYSKNYAQVTMTLEVYVRIPDPVNIEIDWDTPANIEYGTPLSHIQLCARCVSADDESRPGAHKEQVTVAATFQYFPHLGTILPAGKHQLSVVVTFQNPVKYGASASKSIYITVDKIRPNIVWDDPAPIICGTALSEAQLDAICTNDIKGNFLYTPPLGTVMEDGGYHILSVIFFPDPECDKNYRQTSVTVHLLVIESETPNISINAELHWDTPAAICYGTRLTKQQLNAKCVDREFGTEVEGKYEYTPNFGDILGEGSHKLHLLFFPTDRRRYGEVFKSEVTVEVFSPHDVEHPTSPLSKYSAGLRDLVRSAGETVEPAPMFTSRRICFHRLIMDGRVLKKAKFGDVIMKLRVNAEELNPIEMYRFDKVDGVVNFHFESRAMEISASDFLMHKILVSVRGRTLLKGSRVEFTAAAAVPLSQIMDVNDGPFHVTLFAYPKLWLADLHTVIADEDINNKCKLRLTLVAHAYEPKYGPAMTNTAPIFGHRTTTKDVDASNTAAAPMATSMDTAYLTGEQDYANAAPKTRKRPSSANAAQRPSSAGAAGRASYGSSFTNLMDQTNGTGNNFYGTSYLQATPARKLFHSPAAAALASRPQSGGNAAKGAKGRYGPYHELIEPKSPSATSPMHYTSNTASKPRSRPNSAPSAGRRAINRPLVVTESAALAQLEVETAMNNININRWPECTQGKTDLKFAPERQLAGWRPASAGERSGSDKRSPGSSPSRVRGTDDDETAQSSGQRRQHRYEKQSDKAASPEGEDNNEDEYSYI
jgi:hypothetical protein